VHTSIAGGLHLSLRRAHALGCSTLQIFTHNPRAWSMNPLGAEEKRLFKSLRKKLGLDPVFAHASYLINIASPEGELRDKSLALLEAEMERADEVGADYVVLHTGVAHDPDGKLRAAEGIRRVFGGRAKGAGLLIENTAGRSGDIASSVEDLAWLIERSGGLVAGICLDSCHAFAAGYDLRAKGGAGRLSEEIERRIGAGALKLIHLNDSKGAVGSGRDRHEHIGEGGIGEEALRRFVNHGPFRRVPLILETPRKDDADDARNLAAVRRMLTR